MALRTTEIPLTWSQDELGGGNLVLLGFAEHSLHLVAPPGARFKLDEFDDERAAWRHAVWHFEQEEETPVVSIDSPDSVVPLRTSEVVDLLPIDYHDFVRAAMARQLCRAISFGKPSLGKCPDDEDAQTAGRTLRWVNRELDEAFPAEGWFRQERPSVRMPNTIEEFLEHFSDAQSGVREDLTLPLSDHGLMHPGPLRSSLSSHAFSVVEMLFGWLISVWRALTLRLRSGLERVPERR